MARTQNVHIRMAVEGQEIEGAVPVPVDPAPRRVLLPVLQRLTDVLVSVAGQRAAESGEQVTCRKGCDACCRQMVPIAPAEAFGLAELIGAMAPADANRFLERFDAATEKLEQAGVLARLRQRGKLTPAELAGLDRDYFAAQVACPFLEEGACAIHAQRPLACREFLVTSPAEHCRHPGGGGVVQVSVAKLSVALRESDEPAEWLPLALAREFVAGHREKAVDAAGALQGILGRL